MFNKILKNGKTLIWNHYLWFLIGLGAFLLILGSFKISTEAFNNIFKSIGTAILSGGIFSSVLKYFQYVKAFEEELNKIIYGNAFLDSRPDLRELWKKVSSALYKSKFPELKDKIENTIFNEYFPVDHDWYYEKLKHISKITTIDKDYREEIVMIDSIIVASEDNLKLDLSSSVVLYKDENDIRSEVKLLNIEVNGISWMDNVTIEKEEEETKTKSTIKYSVIGYPQYHIKLSMLKTESVKYNPTKNVTFQRFAKDVTVHIEYPKEYNIKFQKMGTVKEFTDINGVNSSNVMWKVYDGIVFPKQGYMLIMNNELC